MTSLTPNAITILEERFLWKDPVTNKVLETPNQLFERVARTVSEVDSRYGLDPGVNYKRFYRALSNLEFIPNTPTLANAGRERGAILSACFVVPVNDSIKDIYHAKTALALIQASGGGTGYCFSRLREEGATVSSGGGTTSGPISFLLSFDKDTETIKQGGIRRGANMGTFAVDHPDIEKFVKLKGGEDFKHFETDPQGKQKYRTGNQILPNFNVSILATDKFMSAVKTSSTIDLVSRKTQEVVGQLDAARLFHTVAQGAWLTGDPGILFVDKMNQDNPFPGLGLYDATNPCGEQPLHDWDSCNLGHINLPKFLRFNYETSKHEMDWIRLREAVELGIDFLDNVIDANEYPLTELEDRCTKSRKIGLGIMGFANVLISLGIAYGSNESYTFAQELMKFIYKFSVFRSIERAASRGSFEYYPQSIYCADSPYYKISERLHAVLDELDCWSLFEKHGLRNSTLVTIAPTGTTARLGGSSFAIEPEFAPGFKSKVLNGKELLDLSPQFQQYFEQYDFTEEEIDSCLRVGSVQHITRISEELRAPYVCSYDLTYKQHIEMQAVFQQWCDSAVSKTINLSEETTLEEIKQAYMYAYDLGCKGITVFRNNCKKVQVLNLKEDEEVKVVSKKVARDMVLTGNTYRHKYNNHSVYITINNSDEGPYELFINMGKTGTDTSATCEALGKLISRMFQEKIDPSTIVDHLDGIGSDNGGWSGPRYVKSIPDIIAKTIKQHIGTMEKKEVSVQLLEEPDGVQTGLKCTDCG